ncbi:MAG: PIG-L family deacetylase [Deltaproteobacteria bacterium]|nr:PIG-L family deacetylase [Deltaproteobacteria bacterium]
MVVFVFTQVPAARAQTVCPPASSDAFAFASTQKQTTSLQLEPQGQNSHRLRWPQVPALTDSGLLFLNLRSEGTSAPMVRLTHAQTTSVQTLNPGAAGTRAINVSAFAGLQANDEIAITLTNATLTSSSATLIVFANRLPLTRPLLVVAPHPDDAEIAAFGLYADRKTTVVTVTAGNAGEFNYCQTEPDPAAHYRLKGELRAIDSVTVPWQGGVSVFRAFNLGYFDGRLKAMFDAPKEPAKELFVDNDDVWPYRRMNQAALLPIARRKATWSNLVADLRAVLRKVRPAIVVAPDPRLDHHKDHQMTTVALWQALQATNSRPVILLYSNHAEADRFPWGGSGEDMPPVPWCGPPLQALGFYAHPLDAALRKRKLLALESMHDLRLPPAGQYDFHAAADDRCQTRPGLPLAEDTYLRRAVRTHEVFLTTDKPGLQALVQGFLQ